MAPKHKALSNSQPSNKKEEKEQPSSSEDIDEQESEEEGEEVSSGEEEEGSSEEEEEDQENEIHKTPNSPPEILSNSIAHENEADSEPESEDSPADYKLQPIPKTSITTPKRAQQEINDSQHDSKSNKRTKTEKNSASAVSPTPGAGCITRLFSDGDEIALLNGLIEFKNLKDTDMGAFYDSIRGKLQVDFSRDQLRTKINRMKNRFFTALKKGENGLDPVFSKPHEVMAFELSKKIWGGEDGNSKGSKNDAGDGAHKKPKKVIVKAEKIVKSEEEILENEKDVEEGIMWSKYPFFSASFDDIPRKFPSLGMSDSGMSHVKENLSLIGNVKANELNEKWKKMLVEETELQYKMLTLMKEQIELALDQ